MLRFSGTPSSEPTTISPRLTLLREGLDLNSKRPYFIAESEIPREGVRLTQAFQRARWTSGKTTSGWAHANRSAAANTAAV